MKQFKNAKGFNGSINIRVRQDNEQFTSEFAVTISNIKKLDVDTIAGTITQAIFRKNAAFKLGKSANALKRNNPIQLQVTDGEGTKLFNTAQISSDFRAQLKINSEKGFRSALYSGLAAINEIHHAAKATEMIDETTDAGKKELKLMDIVGNPVMFERQLVSAN